MASHSMVTTMSNDASKKPKSLKDLKKAQKDKQAARRAAASANFKVKKAIVVFDVPKEESVTAVHVEVPQASDDAQVVEGTSTQTITEISSMADGALSSQTIDLQAHRKALEAALYENMETPKQMLIRVNFVITVDAEYHHYGDDDELPEDDDEDMLKCRDDNRFVITPIVGDLHELATTHGALLADRDVLASLTAEPTKSQQEDTPIIHSLTMKEMFSRIKTEGISVFGSSGFKSSQTLESVELEQTKTLTITQLFTLASQTGKTILRATNMNNPYFAQSVESVECEMCSAHHNPEGTPSAPFIDPAIISSQIKKNPSPINNHEFAFTDENPAPASDYAHSEASEKLKSLIGIGSPTEPFSTTNSQPSSRRSSQHGTGYCTPVTRFSASPPPAASEDVPPAFFGGYYPIWAKTFAEPPYTCAPPPLMDFSSGDQPFYGPLVQSWPVYQPHADRWHPSAWA